VVIYTVLLIIEIHEIYMTKADGRRSKFLVRDTRYKILIQETSIQVAHSTIQVSRTRNMADDAMI